MKPVESSSIAAIGHDPETNELHVQFKNGKTYTHYDVPATSHELLMGASSIGAHYNAHIKGRFEHKRHED